jgi:hypothetical protein
MPDVDADHPSMPHHGMTPHLSGQGEPVGEEYVILDDGTRAGARSYIV